MVGRYPRDLASQGPLKFIYSTHFIKENLLTYNSGKSTKEKLKTLPMFLASALTEVSERGSLPGLKLQKAWALLEAFHNPESTVFYIYLHGNM